MIEYTVHFNRVSRVASSGDFTATGEDAQFDIARMITDAGLPDGSVTFYDERGTPCMTSMSVHAAAARYRPNEADLARRKANAERRKQKKENNR